ncbi:MAG: tetratricopeptide repeat protein [Lewinellaceae bacterium]|nr:tetratricopeptide repeat protein [Lewinellaceae bacterium]
MLLRYFILPLFLFAGLGYVAQAQETTIRYFHPVFSPTLTGSASGERGVIRALVVGAGYFQNKDFGPLPNARRDAEAFAAFLKTPAGGSVTWENLVLLTNEQATLANVANALDWIVSESRQGDKIILFLSTSGHIRERSDAMLLFFDSPAAPADAGSMALARLTTLLAEAAARKGARVFAAVEITPYQPVAQSLERWTGSESRGGLFLEKMTTRAANTADSLATSGHSFGNALLRGLLGLADTDHDEKVYAPELLRYLKTPQTRPDWAGRCAYMAVSDKTDWLCKAATGQSREKLAAQEARTQTPILQLEVQPLDDFIATHGDAPAQRMYEDFILAIRLGQLLTPPTRCAATLLDSLLQIENLVPVYRHLRRRMAVAYQDETQQAINAYLQTSAKELARRRKDHDYYKLYPQYLQRTADLLGPNHFMHQMIEVKRLYFEALTLRLGAQHHPADTLHLPAAMQHLWRGVELEPEAAFLFNEMGVVSSTMQHYRAAEDYFLLALERSPAWSIPQVNLSIVLQQQNRLAEAGEAGIKAISLGPWNPDGYVNLAIVYQKQGMLDSAAVLYHRALKIDPELPGAHYNLACVQAQQRGQTAAALESLRLAIKYGFNQPEHIVSDQDLESLHGTPAFEKLIAQAFPDFRR